MKKHIKFLVVAMIMVLTMGTFLAEDKHDAYWRIYDTLDAAEQLRFDAIKSRMRHEGDDAAWNEFIFLKNKELSVPSSIVQYMVTYEKAWGTHVDELKNMGYTDVDYSAVQGTSPAQPAEQPSVQQTEPAQNTQPEELQEPVVTPFSVEPIDPPKTMWTTSEVNIRDGADTTYNKIGSLKQYEAVTVNGVASTGWYRFTKDGVEEAYVSGKYLTEEDPSSRTVSVVEENGDLSVYEFTDTDPELIDAAIAQIEKENASETETETVTTTEEEPAEETAAATEPESMEEPESSESIEDDGSRFIPDWWYAAGVIGILAVIGFAIYMIIKKK